MGYMKVKRHIGYQKMSCRQPHKKAVGEMIRVQYQTEDGQIRKQLLHPDDKVMVVPKRDPRMVLKKVTNVFRGTTSEWVHVETNGEELKCTREHPYYVEGKGWVAAGSLQSDDQLKTANGPVYVDNVWFEQLDEPETTYNIEVEGAHNYFVGENGILAHNRCTLGERMKRAGLLDDTQDAHHLYPKKFKNKFASENLGIDVDDVVNGYAMDSVKHRAGAQRYNRLWADVDKAVGIKNLSQAEASQYMKDFMQIVYGVTM